MRAALLSFVLLTLGSDAAQDSQPAKPGSKPIPPGHKALAMLKSLAGDWKSVKPDAHAAGEVAVSYKLVGGGSTVVETLYPGSDHEMISMYHLDGDKLVMTHYCALGNQPKMRGEFDKKKANLLHMKFAGGTNFDPQKDAHIHEAQIEFVSKDRLRSEWVLFDGGRKDHSKKFDLVRIKRTARKVTRNKTEK